MSDVRLLLKEKADIETAMQRDLAPHIRAFAQQELDKVCKQIEEAHKEWDKIFEQYEIDQLKARVSELEASNKEMLAELESNMRLCRDRIYHSCDGCVLNESCSLRKAIDRAKGLQQ